MTSTSIYTNQKNYPYVYRLDNPITNEFYIGYRKANKVPAEQDLGTDYFTSAPAITERFNEFQTTILAEFFNPNDAYDHEQYLIYCDLGNPLMLNISCFYGKARFNNTGRKHSAETKAKISTASTGRKPSAETKIKMSASQKGKPQSAEHIAKLSAARKGKPKSAETRVKISAAKKGKPAHNKGKHVSEETKAKISAAKKGKIRGPFSAETRAKKKQTEDNKPFLSCPHCNSSGKGGNWTRWHFDKCKLL